MKNVFNVNFPIFSHSYISLIANSLKTNFIVFFNHKIDCTRIRRGTVKQGQYSPAFDGCGTPVIQASSVQRTTKTMLVVISDFFPFVNERRLIGTVWGFEISLPVFETAGI